MRSLVAWVGRHRTYVSIAVVIAMIAAAFAALHHLTASIRVSDVRAAYHAISAGRIALAIGFTIVSYLALTLYDYLALRVIGRPLPWRTAALASFTSYTLSHNLGLSLVTGGSARYRIYSRAGLEIGDVARVVAIAATTFWLGVLAITGIALAVHQGSLSLFGFDLAAVAVHGLGIAVVAVIAGAIVFCALGARRISIFGWKVPLPSTGQALGQVLIASIDLAAASAALFVLIPGADPALLPTFVLAYSLGIIATVVTHVPGGIGVFEAVVIATVPADKPALFAALIAYRLVYYLLPLACGIVALGFHEGRDWRLGRTLASARSLAVSVSPLLMSAASFIGGAVLLLSGSTPGIPSRLTELHSVLPLPFIEASHLAASLVGTALLLLAPGLSRRLDGAFVAARLLLIAGAVFSLAKGIDYEEAIICLSIAGLLQWTRAAFYRKTVFVAEPFSLNWLACVAAVCGLVTWIGLFSYKHVAYQDSLWWDLALHSDAPRYLRASLGAAVALIAAAMWRLSAPAPSRVCLTTGVGDVAGVLAQAERTDAMLALTGDKRFLFATEGDAFLMYQVEGASWIMMADPVGPRERWSEMLWTLRTMADAAQGRLMLYQITAEMLEIAIELGLQIVKYGEEALVDLPGFSLEGSKMRTVRQAERRAIREGGSFEVVPAAQVAAMMRELTAISDEWLAAKNQREKGFSLGRFDPAYVGRFDCAIVRCNGRIVAFANIWSTENRRELSVDLMRHGAGAPPGIMDYLFVSLMQWGKAQGYARFSLGLAPLSGIEDHRLSPIWAKAAAILFNHGERFYGFKGLRSYKEKFATTWEPRYIAASQGLGLIKAIHDLNRLIGRSPDSPPMAEPAPAAVEPMPRLALAS